MHAPLLLVVCSLIVINSNAGPAEDSMATRSTKVEGFLKCGRDPLADAHIHLGQVIATGKTDAQGRFSIEGDTSRFTGAEAQIDPLLRIYHKCLLKDGDVQLRFPRDFVTLGRVPRRTYNIGALNLELTYPKETKISNLEGI